MEKRKSENPTAVRSRELLKGALLDLLREEPLSDISISQICARAQLTRPTFYNHFASKEAIAAEMIDDALDDFSEHIECARIESTQGMLRAFLDYWASRWGLLCLISDNGLLPLVGERFEPHLDRIYRSLPYTDKHCGTKELAFHNAFLAAGMTGMLRRWACHGLDTSSEQLATYMEHMITTLAMGMEHEEQ